MSVIRSSRRPGLNVNLENCTRSNLIEKIEEGARKKIRAEEEFSAINKKEFISKYGKKEWQRINKERKIKAKRYKRSFKIATDGGQILFGGGTDGPGVSQDSELPTMDK